MMFSTCLVFMCALVPLLTQGQHVTSQKDRETMPVRSSCCHQVSDARISEPVKKCFEQPPNSSLHCRLHAFIFVTEKDNKYCVDPGASWLQKRLKRLEDNGILCKIQRQSEVEVMSI